MISPESTTRPQEASNPIPFMPTIANSHLPPPKSWEEFEEICLSAARLRWDSTNFHMHGRRGQKQDGVDVWGDDDNDQPVGIQCKNTLDGVTLKVVTEEVAKAEGFRPALKHLYIATTAQRDASLQADVRTISKDRKASGKFQVHLLFWDDVVNDLAKDDVVVFKHYPQFKGRAPSEAISHDRALFAEYSALINSDGVIGFIDQHNMNAHSFKTERLYPLEDFAAKWNVPEREFILAELDALRADLWTKTCAYLDKVNVNVFPANGVGWVSVPPEWEYTQEDRFKEVVDTLHRQAGEIVAAHDLLVRTAKRLLY